MKNTHRLNNDVKDDANTPDIRLHGSKESILMGTTHVKLIFAVFTVLYS